MKKYNLSAIMKTAWGFFRNGEGSFSVCLKKSWADAKSESKTKEIFYGTYKDYFTTLETVADSYNRGRITIKYEDDMQLARIIFKKNGKKLPETTTFEDVVKGIAKTKENLASGRQFDARAKRTAEEIVEVFDSLFA